MLSLGRNPLLSFPLAVAGVLEGSVLGEAVGHPCFVIVCTGINIAAVCYLEPGSGWVFGGEGSDPSNTVPGHSGDQHVQVGSMSSPWLTPALTVTGDT